MITIEYCKRILEKILQYRILQKNTFRPQRIHQMLQRTHSSFFENGLPYDYYI